MRQPSLTKALLMGRYILALLLAADYYALDDRYLYAANSGSNEFVQEYIAPEEQQAKLGDRPSFLYWEDQGYRVVNYYVDYCPISKGLVLEYIGFAKSLKTYNVSVYAVSCMLNKHLCLRLNIGGYPVIRLYATRETEDVLGHHHDLAVSELHPHKVLEYFHIPVKNGRDKKLKGRLANILTSPRTLSHHSWRQRLDLLVSRLWSSSSITTSMKPSYMRNETEIELDVHRSLDLMLRTGVFRPQLSSEEGEISDTQKQSPLSDQAQRAMLNWLKLLDETLPPTWQTMRALVHEISDNFNYATKSEDYLVSFLDRHPPSQSEWSPACSHGISKAGYSCGLWTMFHAVTVGAVEFNTQALKRNRLDTEGVARSIRDFVEQFFTCQVCRQHFVGSFDACDHDRCKLLSAEVGEDARDWLQLPLWLARVHNAVNVRRAEEAQQRKKSWYSFWHHQQIATTSTMWPSRTDCRQCWGASGEEQWIEEAVYQHLRQEFFTGYDIEDPAVASATDPTEIRLFHPLTLSCILAGLVLGLWHTTRWSLRRLRQRLTQYYASKDQ